MARRRSTYSMSTSELSTRCSKVISTAEHTGHSIVIVCSSTLSTIDFCSTDVYGPWLGMFM